MSNDPEKIRITADDLDGIQVPAPSYPPAGMNQPFGGGTQEWGSIGDAGRPQTGTAQAGGLGNFFLQAWVYLGLSGAFGAFLGWAVCEPTFQDSGRRGFGNSLLLPLSVMTMCMGFALAESIAERSVRKAVIRGLLALGLGLALGFVLAFIGNIVFKLAMKTAINAADGYDQSNPIFWLVRAVAWVIFGFAGGIVYGIAGQSGRKCVYGMLGGALGAGIGGLLFDPIALVSHGGGVSRCIGLMIFGASTGVAIGLVENALKNRWLFVSGGPLAGKQFILYKPVTQFGSQQSNDIYLFKDPSIAPAHARIELRGHQAILVAGGATYIGGQPVTQRVLRSGDLIQIGRYTFEYHEKRATA